MFLPVSSKRPIVPICIAVILRRLFWWSLMPNNTTKASRRTMAIIRHMRLSAFFLGRPGGLIREIAWKTGRLEVICLHGGLRFHHVGRMAKNFRADFGILRERKRFRSLSKRVSFSRGGLRQNSADISRKRTFYSKKNYPWGS